ncbi:hypothetical protein [Streptomyces sp. NPDC051546]|uniref:hypothetical protein n=1 Tax=Streptomyces sp. NPDC051546 TaxID=3365655 RepID=UPI0037AB636C
MSGRQPHAAGSPHPWCSSWLLTLAQLRLATPRQLQALLLAHQQCTDRVRRALRNLQGESPALVGHTHRAQQSYW